MPRLYLNVLETERILQFWDKKFSTCTSFERKRLINYTLCSTSIIVLATQCRYIHFWSLTMRGYDNITSNRGGGGGRTRCERESNGILRGKYPRVARWSRFRLLSRPHTSLFLIDRGTALQAKWLESNLLTSIVSRQQFCSAGFVHREAAGRTISEAKQKDNLSYSVSV